jgi:hypothetical protein
MCNIHFVTIILTTYPSVHLLWLVLILLFIDHCTVNHAVSSTKYKECLIGFDFEHSTAYYLHSDCVHVTPHTALYGFVETVWGCGDCMKKGNGARLLCKLSTSIGNMTCSDDMQQTIMWWRRDRTQSYNLESSSMRL